MVRLLAEEEFFYAVASVAEPPVHTVATRHGTPRRRQKESNRPDKARSTAPEERRPKPLSVAYIRPPTPRVAAALTSLRAQDSFAAYAIPAQMAASPSF